MPSIVLTDNQAKAVRRHSPYPVIRGPVPECLDLVGCRWKRTPGRGT